MPTGFSWCHILGRMSGDKKRTLTVGMLFPGTPGRGTAALCKTESSQPAQGRMLGSSAGRRHTGWKDPSMFPNAWKGRGTPKLGLQPQGKGCGEVHPQSATSGQQEQRWRTGEYKGLQGWPEGYGRWPSALGEMRVSHSLLEWLGMGDLAVGSGQLARGQLLTGHCPRPHPRPGPRHQALPTS